MGVLLRVRFEELPFFGEGGINYYTSPPPAEKL
jgi:hypothetical protein